MTCQQRHLTYNNFEYTVIGKLNSQGQRKAGNDCMKLNGDCFWRRNLKVMFRPYPSYPSFIELDTVEIMS